MPPQSEIFTTMRALVNYSDKLKSSNKMSSPIIKFLRDDGTDYKGRKLFQLQCMSDEEIERSHDVIQWMFPSDIPSSHFKNSPVLTEDDISIMKYNLAIHGSLQTSLTRMLWFYENNNWWITMKNHNFKRITRILRCLWLADLKHDYVCLQRALDEIFEENSDIIGEETYRYWKRANDKEYLMNPPKISKLLSKYPKREIPEGCPEDEWFQYI